MNDLLREIAETRALVIRHVAAMDVVHTIESIDERYALLFDVLCPRRALEEASLAAAEEELASRGDREHTSPPAECDASPRDPDDASRAAARDAAAA